MRARLSRRRFMVGAGVLGGSTLLAACATTTAAPQQQAEVATEAPTVAPPETVAKVPVLYWQYMTDQEEVETVILKAFAEANPDIDLTWEYIPWQEYWTKLNAALAAGTPADVWNTAPTFYYDYILRNQLADITDMFKQNFSLDDFFPAAMSGYDFRDKYYGVPRNIVTECNWFNTDLFEAAGVDAPPLDGDWTWDDYLTKAQAVVEFHNEGDKITTFGGSAVQNFGWWLHAVMVGNGCEWAINFSRDLVGMELDFTGESCVSTVKYMADLINEYKVAPAAGEFEGQGDAFLTGRLAQTWNLPWVLGAYKDAPFGWDVNLPPKGSAKQVTYGGADGLVMAQASDAKDQSWRLMMWLLDWKTGSAFMEDTGSLPPVNNAEILEAWASKHEGKNVDAVIASSDIAINYYCLGYGELVSAISTELESVFLGSLSPEEGCANATKVGNEKLTSILEQYKEAMGG